MACSPPEFYFPGIALLLHLGIETRRLTSAAADKQVRWRLQLLQPGALPPAQTRASISPTCPRSYSYRSWGACTPRRRDTTAAGEPGLETRGLKLSRPPVTYSGGCVCRAYSAWPTSRLTRMAWPSPCGSSPQQGHHGEYPVRTTQMNVWVVLRLTYLLALTQHPVYCDRRPAAAPEGADPDPVAALGWRIQRRPRSPAFPVAEDVAAPRGGGQTPHAAQDQPRRGNGHHNPADTSRADSVPGQPASAVAPRCCLRSRRFAFTQRPISGTWSTCVLTSRQPGS